MSDLWQNGVAVTCEAINKLIEEEVSTIKKIAQERTAEEVNKIKEEAAKEKRKIEEEAAKEKRKIEEEAAKEKRKVEEEDVKVKEEAAKEIEKIYDFEESHTALDDAIIETNIRYVLKGKISIEEAAEDCGLTVEDFSKKKEEYCENRGISSK